MNIEPVTIWIIAGLVLIVGEMLTAGFFLLFIALGCFAAALTASLDQSYAVQGIVCALFSVIGMLVLRKPIQKKLLKSAGVHADMGKEILVDQDIPPHQQLRITYQGVSWQATNLDSEPLYKDDRAVIVGIDGNILLIRKVH